MRSSLFFLSQGYFVKRLYNFFKINQHLSFNFFFFHRGLEFWTSEESFLDVGDWILQEIEKVINNTSIVRENAGGLLFDELLAFQILLGSIQILLKHSEWLSGVRQRLMLVHAKPVHFTNEVCLHGGWFESRNGPRDAYVIFEWSLRPKFIDAAARKFAKNNDVAHKPTCFESKNRGIFSETFC